jgi:hypothetical protein
VNIHTHGPSPPKFTPRDKILILKTGLLTFPVVHLSVEIFQILQKIRRRNVHLARFLQLRDVLKKTKGASVSFHGTDILIFNLLSPKKIGNKIGVFGSKQC